MAGNAPVMFWQHVVEIRPEHGIWGPLVSRRSLTLLSKLTFFSDEGPYEEAEDGKYNISDPMSLLRSDKNDCPRIVPAKKEGGSVVITDML